MIFAALRANIVSISVAVGVTIASAKVHKRSVVDATMERNRILVEKESKKKKERKGKGKRKKVDLLLYKTGW